ncbi:hypothetical protein ABB37_00607 [Leptomonas pyrrhocoris]|uniref:Sfi1 spindle body domain-containing protein n=1 Tax=Leptomonas pyrrhocoris TaxID=157538 RepID=A0A0M9GB39_LEPPY|nr:hypothetical protein ABB37_00607 [Leptomonas pyrrhocoris]KPA86446.1 hypothetical protein ABB37_00607 [Leptomonas pyrrhocoris]|eukprot:XP_015664885.1 hypothetical protein ABB37_00607 [Leptomonas pyrrhocoris]
MRRYPAHIRNFYDNDDDDVPKAHPLPHTPQDDDAEPLPQPSIIIRPVARCPSRTSSRRAAAQLIPSRSHKEKSDGDSSASIEDVIPWIASSPHADAPTFTDDRNPTADEYVSLHQMEESVEEAKRDIKRLHALMVKAVWHALTQPSAAEQKFPKNAARRGAAGTAVTGSSVIRGRTRDDAYHAHHAAGTTSATTSATLVTFSADATGFFNEKPFLPPDRYPTLPPLTEKTDHFHVNLSRALFAAQRAGLLEKQRAWLQQRQSLLGAASAAPTKVAAASSGSPSTRQTALQRISALSTAATSSNPHGQRAAGRTTAAKPPSDTARGVYETKEELVQSSLSLVVLRVAKDRAVATLFLRQLRLDAYRRQLLRDNVALRYTYYVQRRVLRDWRVRASRQHVWRAQVLQRAVTQWKLYVQRHHALRERLRWWRQELRRRARAFTDCQRTRLLRYWHQWTRTFTWHRERCGLYETAAQFAQSHRRPAPFVLHGDADGCDARSELLALIHGGPLTAKDGGVVATPVGHRLALQRIFQTWKRKTERRLMTHLAGWHRVQCLQRRVVRTVCARAHVLALRAHRQRKEAERRASSLTTAMEEVEALARSTTAEVLPRRAAMRVFAVNTLRPELLKYKTNAASCITHAAQLRRCFHRWRTRFQARCANNFRRQCVYVQVTQRWLHALTVQQQQKAWKALVMGRWVVVARHHRDAAAAARLHVLFVLRLAFHLWHTHFTLRVAGAWHRRRDCFDRWRERAELRAGVRALRGMSLRRLLWRWHLRAQTRVDTRANLYVAATLFETGLLLGCVRRWRSRAGEHRRIRLAWEVLVQLRRERLRQRCFAVWQRRTGGPAAAAAPSRKRPSNTVASPAVSLLV